MKPLKQFEVHTWVPIKIFGLDVSLTNSAVFMLLAVVVLGGFFLLTLRRCAVIPTRRQGVAELVFSFLSGMIHDINGEKGRAFLPFISSVFFFVLIGNLLGLLPYAFTFTGQLIVNMTLAMIVFLCATVIGFLRQGTGYFRIFFPKDVPWLIAPVLIPVEIISYLSRPLSLSVRLFANMLAGHTLMKIVGYFAVMLGVWGVVPVIFNMAFMLFEIFVAFLQAYVFSILSCVYLNDALEGH